MHLKSFLCLILFFFNFIYPFIFYLFLAVILLHYLSFSSISSLHSNSYRSQSQVEGLVPWDSYIYRCQLRCSGAAFSRKCYKNEFTKAETAKVVTVLNDETQRWTALELAGSVAWHSFQNMCRELPVTTLYF